MRLLLILFMAFPVLVYSQENYTLCGNVSDAKTGEDLIGASIYVVGQASGVSTNSYGFYSLTVHEKKIILHFSYVGYEKEERLIDLKADSVLNIELIPSVVVLNEVVIKDTRPEAMITNVRAGVVKLNMQGVREIPVMFGEKDVLKTIQLLPGISTSSEGNTGLTVRGGSVGQNLILLDEAPIYNAAHLAGFFSVFNSDAIKNVTIYKGGVPANYGGRASSVLDITMNNGNSKNFRSTGGIGLISARMTLEGPVMKDKMSFIISGRRTYGDLVAKALFPEELVNSDMKFYFYDLNAKLNYSINRKNRLFISGYLGKDVFELGNDIGTGWGNTTATFRWNRLFGNRCFYKTSLVYSKYQYGFIFSPFGMKVRSGIEDTGFKQDLTWYVNPELTFNTGFDITYHLFKPGEVTINDSTGYRLSRKKRTALEGAFYLQAEQELSAWLKASYGARLSLFSQTGPGWFYEYGADNEVVDSVYYGAGQLAYPFFAIEPRISLNFRLNNSSSVKMSYNRMAQYLHLLSSVTATYLSDIWMPSGNTLKPVIVDQVSAGFFRDFGDNNYGASLEIYYKRISNSADYEDGAGLILDEHGESQILSGKGRSGGVEIFLEKKNGSFTGWISYTLSRTENKIIGINNYSWYPVKYDRTNNLSVVTVYKISRRLTISAVWTYATGNAVTFPSGRYVLDGQIVPYYTERNGYRMPAYHRLDLNLSLKCKENRKNVSRWDFSVYNLYNRHNAYMINFRESETTPGSTEAVKLSLFGIVPSITYEFRF